MKKQFITLPQAAKMASVSVPTFERWMINDGLTVPRLGRGRTARLIEEQVALRIIENRAARLAGPVLQKRRAA